MKSKTGVEAKMQSCLARLGIPLKVVWMPQDNALHGEIKSNCILIYDRNESEAWLTFQHEVYEFKLCRLIAPSCALLLVRLKLDS
jgi:hypothetical protein